MSSSPALKSSRLSPFRSISSANCRQENLDSAVTAITDVLKKYNLNLMPGTAFDVMCFTLETMHLGNYDLKAKMLKECGL